MNPSKENPQYSNFRKLLQSGNKEKILKRLEQLTNDDGGLFREDETFKQFRRRAWLFRIDLLLEWGRMSEALAWVCLETELNPGNVSAQALKIQLKKMLNLFEIDNYSTVRQVTTDRVFEWAGVAGMREIRAMLEEEVILPLREPEIFIKYKVPLPNGILMYGPPGCGKTFIARKLAEQVNYTFIEVVPSDLASIYVHGGQEKIGELFKGAKEKSPTVLFLDEIDALLPNRGTSSVGYHYQAEVNEFLVHLDQASKQGILVIGATNNIDNLDQAAIRSGRFDKKIYIGPPDFEARMEAFKIYMSDRPQEKIDWAALATISENRTFADIELLVNEAGRLAIKSKSPITQQMLVKVIPKSNNSFTSKDIKPPGIWN